MKPFGIVVALLLAIISVAAQPARILIIRHAEKPPDGSKDHLTREGNERARALVPFLTQTPQLLGTNRAVALFATRVSKTAPNNHTHETLEPLASELGLKINDAYRNSDYQALADRLLSDPIFKDRTVVICWTHTYIPQLVKSLGISPELPAWNDRVYDRVLVITYEQRKAKMADLPQKLLFGDASK